jgi:hypothetical protein
MARLRLIESDMLVRELLSREPAPAWDVEAEAQAERVAEFCLDALLASVRAPRPILLPAAERIEDWFIALAERGSPSLAWVITRKVIDGVDQALEGTLARHGQLVELPESSRQPLQALGLAQRWAHLEKQDVA